MSEFQMKMKTQIGDIYLIASENGLRSILFKKRDLPLVQSLDQPLKAVQILKKVATQLNEYFEGHRKSFDLAFDLNGTEFQKSVWNQLLQIPYGATCTYSDIARKIKNEKAVRAVGAANGRNPISIVIPCHRVIGADGSLTGYAGGLERKTKLLAIEGYKSKNQLKMEV